MPRLEWVGKDKVIAHHLEVPYRVLDRQYTYGDGDGGNMVIHGDNLEALKALLPRFESRVKCVYIDPPYNTGNEGWVNNDNVNDPKTKKLLGEVVGKEGEDLSRHDKWLCMMYPRLKLLQKLLAEDGVIFISIGDEEHSKLRMICDEIFGPACFVANVIWQNNYSPRNDTKGIAYTTDNILVFSKTPGWTPKRLERTEEMDSRFTSPDNDPIPWTSSPAHAPDSSAHRGMVYAIQHPYTGEIFYPPAGRHWAQEQGKMLSLMNAWANFVLKPIDDLEKRAELCGETDTSNMPNVAAIMLDEPLDSAKRKVEQRYQIGVWPELYFTSKGRGGIRTKKHLSNMGGKAIMTLWPYAEVGTTTEAKNELKRVFDNAVPFDTPKPTRLIERILQITTNPGDIILDSFAGSGTTAHAVLNMNKADGGNRRFILIEMEDYAESITAERVKRVIGGYGEGRSAVEGTGGGFVYYELGAPLLLPDGNLNEEVSVEKIREYVWYTETRKPFIPPENGQSYYLGRSNGTDYFFYYERDRATVLDYDFLATLPAGEGQRVIYADLCGLSGAVLDKLGIVFKKIPRDIKKL